MRRFTPRLIIGCVPAIGMLVATATASAQTLTVQQPVFRSFSATTTVSVPDRGSSFLAGVGRAADSRSRFGFGPLRSGTNVGTERDHAGMNVGVWIHDFEEMDRRLLEGGGAAGSGGSPSVLSDQAGTAWSRLHARHDLSTPLARSADRKLASTNRESPSARAERYYRLGVAAEQRGSTGAARSHYLAAARYGSNEARERLDRWDSPAVAER